MMTNIDYKVIRSLMCKIIGHLLSDLFHEEQIVFVIRQPTQINIGGTLDIVVQTENSNLGAVEARKRPLPGSGSPVPTQR